MLVHADARALPMADESVDAIVDISEEYLAIAEKRLAKAER